MTNIERSEPEWVRPGEADVPVTVTCGELHGALDREAWYRQECERLSRQFAGAVEAFEEIRQVLEDRERAGWLTQSWQEDAIGRLILRHLRGQ